MITHRFKTKGKNSPRESKQTGPSRSELSYVRPHTNRCTVLITEFDRKIRKKSIFQT